MIFSELTAGGIPPPQEKITFDLSCNELTSFSVVSVTLAASPLANTTLGGMLPTNVTLFRVKCFSSFKEISKPILKRFTPISGSRGAETLHGDGRFYLKLMFLVFNFNFGI
jgi:hypothetical protein